MVNTVSSLRTRYTVDVNGAYNKPLGNDTFRIRNLVWWKDFVASDLTYQWSSIYWSVLAPTLTITSSKALFLDANSTDYNYVISTDLPLTKLSSFLAAQESGKSFIIEKDGKLVATSQNDDALQNLTRINLWESKDPQLAATGDFIR